jgi:predicted RNA binding protein YcfA (HicA-like mRNA interferase family)
VESGTACGTVKGVSRWSKVLAQLRSSPNNVRFDDLCGLVVHVGFKLRNTTGSHKIYRHPDRPDLPLVNLQRPAGGKAKPYQVKQVLEVIEAIGFEEVQ